MSEPRLTCPECKSEQVMEWQGALCCRACQHSFNPVAATPPPLPGYVKASDVDAKIRQAVAEALKSADQRVETIATAAAAKAISEVATGLMEQYREQGERSIEKAYLNLAAGVFCALIGVCMYNGDPEHPESLIWFGVILLSIGAALHKRGKKLVTLADEYKQQVEETKT